MQLNCLERLMALQLLATYKEGDFVTFKMLQGLRTKLGFNDEEIVKFGFKEEQGQYQWNPEGMKDTDIELSGKEVDLIKIPLMRLDEEKKLTPMHVTLYEKFVISE